MTDDTTAPVDGLRVEVGADGVLRLTLDRPEARNALSAAMRDGLLEAVRAARGDDRVRALLLRGAGGHFCAGMDLRESTVKDAGSPGFDPRRTAEALRSGIQALVRELWELDKPVVAAVDGAAVGPGAHLALACDVVVVTPRTRFVWSFSRWGLVVDGGGGWLLPRLVGTARAKALVLLGEELEGATAVEWGLVHRCVAVEELDRVAEELATRLAAGPTRALGLSKRLLNTALESPLAAALEAEAQAQALATTTADLAEGMRAFRERRPPRFEGR